MMTHQGWHLFAVLISIYILLIAILFDLMWTYPAAAVLLPALLLYAAVCLGLRRCMRKKDADLGKKASRVRRRGCECLLLLSITDLYGLFCEEDGYLIFNLLCCLDGIAMCGSLASSLKAIYASMRARAGAKNGLEESEEAVPEKQTTVGRKIRRGVLHPAVLIVLYIALGALLPFAYQPSVSDSTVEAFDASEFYSEEASGERAKVISQNGEALEERIRMISQAEDTIILSTFEFHADTSGKMVLAALMEAAERGVQVFLIVDGATGLKTMWNNPYFLALAQTENVEIKTYDPICLWKPWTFMGRLHDKYLIVDDLGYILGGRNTFDYFLGDQEGSHNYDWDILVYSKAAGEDNSLLQVTDYFASVWELSASKAFGESSIWADHPAVLSAKEELYEAYEAMAEEHPDWLEAADYESMTVPVNHIELVSNPTQILAKEPVVFYTITELMMQTQESVTFHTPYIICNDWMLERLEEICDAVDSVTMMTNSVANNGNPFGASDYDMHKADILETGVQTLEYEGGVSYHGKCFLIDDRLSGIGSFNWDMRSAYVDTELMLVVDSEELNAQLREEMLAYESDSLTVLDAETSIAPEGMEAQEVSAGKRAMLRLLRFFNWGRFAM